MTPTPERPDAEPVLIKVTVEDAGREKLLQVTWEKDRLGWRPYLIDGGTLDICAEEVRKRLSELKEQAYNKERGGAARSGKQLKQLAEAGFKLYQALFNDEDDAGIPEKVQRTLGQLQKAKHPCKIQFVVQKRIFIPWGLIYGDDPATLTEKEEDVDVERYEAFWCLRYLLATTYDRIAPSFGRDRIEPDAFRVLAACADAVLIEVRQAMSRSEQGQLDEFVGTYKPALKKCDLLSRWKAVTERWGLMYFLCHATATRLALGEGEEEEINITDFNLTLKDGRKAKDGEEKEFLVFLNGCLTAVGDSKGGFLEATGGKGFVGFIGTEVVVPNVFAARFGQAFLGCLLHSDWPVDRIMNCLRRQHWPLSLLYGTYCDPSIRIRLSEGVKPCVARDAGNYSLMVIASGGG